MFTLKNSTPPNLNQPWTKYPAAVAPRPAVVVVAQTSAFHFLVLEDEFVYAGVSFRLVNFRLLIFALRPVVLFDLVVVVVVKGGLTDR
jgi:hypothetical protein